MPVEYVNGNADFIGRFTHGETSDQNFSYPGINDATNPFTRTDLAVNANGVVAIEGGDNTINTNDDIPYNGPRVMEDLVLTNVHEFDIKVWDPGFTVGSDGQPGNDLVDDDSNGVVDDVSELGWPGTDDWYGPDNQPGQAGTDDDGVNGVDDIGEIGWPNSDDVKRDCWFDLGHTSGDARYHYRSAANLNTDYGNRFDTWSTQLPANMPGTSGLAPFRPAEVGTNNEVPPLRAIRIHIRYLDPSSQLMRDLTIVYSL